MTETVLITGASGKIGINLVHGFLEKGNNVIALCFRETSRVLLEKEFSNDPKLSVISIDLMAENAVQNLVKKLLKLGRFPTILINNARNLENMKVENHLEVSREKFLSEFLLGVEIPFELTMGLFKIKNSKLKVVINISSIYGLVVPNLTIYESKNASVPVHYGVAKAALNHLTKELAVRLADHGIRVNAVAFGGVEGRASPQFVNNYSNLSPNQRMLSADDLFGPIEFLISDRCRAITGEVVAVDGGWTLW